MTITDDDMAFLIDNAVHRALTAAGIDTPPPVAPVATAAVDPDGYPGAVAAGELVQSAWGNATVNTLRKVSTTWCLNAGATQYDLPLIQGSNRAVVGTDVASNFRITFPLSYSAPPIVMILNAFMAFPNFHFTTNIVSAIDVVIQVRRPDGSTFASNSLEVSWLAIGRR